MPDQVDRDWTEEEKYGLLTVILRNAGVPSNHLVELVRQLNITPPWFDMPLPPGRTVNECRQQFQTMWQSSHPPPPVRSTESWQAPPPPSGYQVFNPSPVNTVPLASSAHDAYASRKRPLYSTDKPNFPRAIQPRPPHSNVQFGHDAGSPGSISPGWGDHVSGKGPEPPRKRGRPSKMESERRKAEAEARGESYPPPRRRLSKTKNPATPSGGASATSDSSMVSPMHVAHTPEIQKQDRLPETPAPTRETPAEQGTQSVGADTPDAPDTDPVKGIIRSQSSQDRRLPLPHEFPTRGEGFGMRTSPREPLLSQNAVFEAAPTPRPQEKTMHPPAEPHLLAQAQSGPPIHQSGGYVTTAISPHPGETKT
ncbi:hypothetical protein PISL3812_05609 [Talaromyces islandicus]|uniref:Uncharacterized protein n=1 Tax=Talaromyces islandicus TaxID=28573 RepID=A0A0U1LZ22_TALIS|nr:hypothetical protein PISL3812_05609 [Talaromyces islandicus]